jgi:uncharacterized protein YkwD
MDTSATRLFPRAAKSGIIILTTALAAALAGCGGGGGASTTPAGQIAAIANQSTSSNLGSSSNGVTTSTTASLPSATTASVTYSGAVVDAATGSPIAGATVTFNGMSGLTSLASQRFATVDGSAARQNAVPQTSMRTYRTSASRRAQSLSVNGTFTYSAKPGDLQSVVVSAPGYVTYTNGIQFPSGATALRHFTLTAISAPIASWLSQVNSDRAAYGAAPLALDESITEAAQQHANEMQSHGYFAHDDLEGRSPSQQCAASFALGDCGQNIAKGYASGNAAETAFMAESSLCPVQPATFANCPFQDTPGAVTGHFVNIINPAYTTVGLATVSGAAPYAVENFSTATTGGAYDPLAVPVSVSPSSIVTVTVRVFGAAGIFPNVFSDNCVLQAVPASQLTLAFTPPSCSTTSPTLSGVTLTQSSADPNLIQLTATAPSAPGHLYLGVASGSSFLVIVPVTVN